MQSQPPFSQSSSQSALDLQIALAHFLRFSREDLECNRQGRLSPTQHRKLSRNNSSLVIVAWIFLLLGAVALVFFLHIALPAAGLPCGGLLILMGCVCLFVYVPRNRASLKRGIQVLEGIVQTKIDTHTEDQSDELYYCLGEKWFLVDLGSAKELEENNPLIPTIRYRLYYVPQLNYDGHHALREVLSIEPLEAPSLWADWYARHQARITQVAQTW